MIWQRFPLFRVFLAFCAGILIANFLHPHLWISVAVFGTGCLLVILTAFYKQIFYTYSHRWLFGFSLSLFFVGLGLLSSHLYSEKPAPQHLRQLPGYGTTYQLQLLETPLEKERSYGAKARVLRIINDSTSQNACTNIMLYLQKDSAAAQLRYGDRLIIRDGLSELQAPANPFEFDYRDFLHLKAIYYQAYADANSWKKTGSGYGNPVLAYAGKLREQMLEIIDSWRLNPKETAITKALLMGYRYDIKDDQLKAYASAGAMHVLAVSGLHVGIVYIMAASLLFFLEKIKHGSILRTVLLVLMLWGFALLTGMSASVVRASTMFSFVAIGTSFRRSTSVYNTILGSAMLLLLFKPTYLFEVGFQLSYAAVFGIVWLQPKFERLWQPPGWILSQIWSITTVSLAAQIATFPLGLYYFHQFPALFLLSNLIVIPLVSLLMYIGISGLLLSAAGVYTGWLLWLYQGLLWQMNTAVEWIERQASFLINEIQIDRLELSLLYLIILAGFTWLFAGGYKRLALVLSATVLFCTSQLREQWQINNQEQMVVYAVNRQPAIGFYSRDEGLLLCDSSLWADESSLTFHIKHHWWAMDLKEVHPVTLTDNLNGPVLKQGNLLHFRNKLIWLYPAGAAPLPGADLWVVHENCSPPGQDVDLPKEVVLSGALDYYNRRKWRDWLSQQAMNFWDTESQGAYIMAAN